MIQWDKAANLKERIGIVLEYLDEVEHPPMAATVRELMEEYEKALRAQENRVHGGIIRSLAEAVGAVCGVDTPDADIVRELVMSCKRLEDALHQRLKP